MTPGTGVLMLGCGHISHLEKIHYSFKKTSSLLPDIDQTNYIYNLYIHKFKSTKDIYS